MIIHCTRDSVCFGDDCNDNSRNFIFTGNADINKVMRKIIRHRFFPIIAGNDVVWLMQNSDKVPVLAYFTKENKIVQCSDITSLKNIGGNTLHFRYFTSPEKFEEFKNQNRPEQFI